MFAARCFAEPVDGCRFFPDSREASTKYVIRDMWLVALDWPVYELAALIDYS